MTAAQAMNIHTSRFAVEWRRLLFWACWAATVSVPFFVLGQRFFQYELTSTGIVLMLAAYVGLFFTSYSCKTKYPRLSLLGRYTIWASIPVAFILSILTAPIQM